MLELSFSEPPIVFVRLGLHLRRAQRAVGGGPATLSKVVLVGQVLVQLPPRDTGVPAILKLLIDVVGLLRRRHPLPARAGPAARLVRRHRGVRQARPRRRAAGGGAVRAKPAFVLSAGGFHPRYVDLPERVPRDLDKLRVSFKLGPVSLSIEHYFAITPNSVQAGAEGVAEGRLRRGQDRGVARLGRPAVPVAAVLLHRRPRVQGQGQGVRSDAGVGHRDGHAGRPRRVALRRQVQLLDPVVGQDDPVPRALRRGPPGRDRHRPRSARRCRPSSPTPTTSPSRRRRARTRSPSPSPGRASSPTRRAAGGPPAGGAARAAGRAARNP